jgi:hypothetical protein
VKTSPVHLPAAKLPVALANVSVASPCTASWERMSGDDRAHHCRECNLNVYNLSEMTGSEAEQLIASREGRLCVRFYRRADGTIITRDCPRALKKLIQRVSRIAGAALSAMMSLSLASAQTVPQISTQNAPQPDQGLGELMFTVFDPQGATIEKSHITLVGDQSHKQVAMNTDSSGRARFPGLTVGTYTISVSAQGFETSRQTSRVASGVLAFNVTLPLGAVQGEMVEVRAFPYTNGNRHHEPGNRPYPIQPVPKVKKRR